MPDNTARLVADLLTQAGELRREAEHRADPIGRTLVEVADRFEAQAFQLLGEPPMRPSTTYRIFFRNGSGICGRDDFDAESDDTAMKMAELLADACSDKCTSFDVWQGTRLVTGLKAVSPRPRVSLSELTEKHQALTIAREEAIRDSYFAIAGSRRLLMRLDEVRQKR